MLKPIEKKKFFTLQNITWILLLALLFVLALRFPSDPDMGWHLRNGADLLKDFNLVGGDIYSWTMAGYPWVPHEWLTDILMTIINNSFGLWGLVIIFTTLIAYLFYFAAGIFKTNKITQAIIAIIALSVSYNIIGIRPQMVTLLGVAVVLYILFKARDTDNIKLIRWLPLVMLLWVNLHGGFGVAFIIIATFLFAEFIKIILLAKTKIKKDRDKILSIKQIKNISIFTGISFLATLINPSGWKVYLEIYQTFSDREILNSISEWISVSLYHPASYNFAILAVIILVLLFINKWKVDITKLILAMVIFYFSTTSWRHVPLFAIVAIPLLAEQISYVIGDELKAFSKHIFMPTIVLIMMVIVSGNYYTNYSAGLSDETIYANLGNYPYGAVEYMKANDVGNRLLNEYNWGGYLIWKYPQEKVFIDGRMAIWKWDDLEIFKETKLVLGDHRQNVLDGLDRWNIDHILTTPGHPIRTILKKEENWQQVYGDNIATVWVKS